MSTKSLRSGFLLLVWAASHALAAEPREGDWIVYNGDLTGQRYSPLKTITTANVSTLQRKCAFDAPDTVSFQSGLVAVNGVLYFTVWSDTYAIDGSTCKQKWKHSRDEPDNFLKVNRGVAYSDGKVFRGTGDGHVLALDAQSGKVLWDVTIADPKKGESVPIAPIAWGGLVFVGNAGGDNFGVTGRIYALEAASGKTVWVFRTVPKEVFKTWHKASEENPPTGGATWTSYSLDESKSILYVSTGNSAPDFMEEMHPGENLYTHAVLALEAKTGKLIAYVQPYKADYHDWDMAAAPLLISTRSGRPMLAAGSKDGYVYFIDRSAIKTTAGSQPDPKALAVRAKGLATIRENAEAPLTSERLTRFCPGSQGGIEWNGPAYHVERGILYTNATHWCTSVKLLPAENMKGEPGQAWTGMDDPKLAFGQQDPTDQWKGFITALDPETGKKHWQVETPKPMVAAITATASGLLFTGDLDGNALAYDAATGKELWRNNTGKPIGGGVISYDAGGKQYVAVAAGLNSAIWPVHGGAARVVVYGLP